MSIFSKTNQDLYEIRLSKAKDKLSTELDGETVILDMQSGIYSGLDQVGTTIWNMLDQEVTIPQLRDEILARYEVSAEECENDLLEFLESLRENNLLEIAGHSAGKV